MEKSHPSEGKGLSQQEPSEGTGWVYWAAQGIHHAKGPEEADEAED